MMLVSGTFLPVFGGICQPQISGGLVVRAPGHALGVAQQLQMQDSFAGSIQESPVYPMLCARSC